MTANSLNNTTGLGYTIPSCGREGESYSPFVLLLNHNRLTNITYGFLQVENSVQNITPILDVLRSNNNLHSEAALLPLLFLESRLAEYNMRILQPYIKFNALETQLGQNEDSSGSGTDLMALNLNLGEMMRSINDATKALSLDEAYPWIMLSVMDTIVAWKGECCVIQDTRQHIDLNNRIRFVQDICKVVLAKARREQKRGKILIQWVRFTFPSFFLFVLFLFP